MIIPIFIFGNPHLALLFGCTWEKNKLLIILLRKSTLSRHIIHHSFSKNIKVYWFKQDLNVYIWSLTKTKINHAVGKKQLCYTKNETFNPRSELTSMTSTNSRAGRGMANISTAFNRSAFPSRRSKDFFDTLHRSCVEENHHLQNLTQWANIEIFSSSHSEPSWHYWNMNCSFLLNQSISFVFMIKKIKKQAIFLMSLLKWPHWLLLLHQSVPGIFGLQWHVLLWLPVHNHEIKRKPGNVGSRSRTGSTVSGNMAKLCVSEGHFGYGWRYWIFYVSLLWLCWSCLAESNCLLVIHYDDTSFCIFKR